MRSTIEELRNSSKMCFACGEDNPIGLKLKFKAENGVAIADFKLGPYYQGYNNIAHGGIITTILDEAMVYAIASKGYRRALTSEITVRFLYPLFINKEYRVEAEVLEEADRWAVASSRIISFTGKVIAEGRSKFRIKQ